MFAVGFFQNTRRALRVIQLLNALLNSPTLCRALKCQQKRQKSLCILIISRWKIKALIHRNWASLRQSFSPLFFFFFFLHVSVSSVSGLKQNLTNQLSSAFSRLFFFFYTASAVLAGVKCHALQMSALAWAPLSSHDGRTCFCVGGLFCQAKLFWSLFFFSCFFFSKSCCCFTKCCLVTGQIRKECHGAPLSVPSHLLWLNINTTLLH